jgi:hypothetical protein
MKKIILSIVCVLALSFLGFSQDNNTASHTVSVQIEQHALVDIEAPSGVATSIVLKPSAPTEAGLGITMDNVKNNDLWLNYSSIVQNGQPRTVKVKVDGNLPNSLGLYLKTSSYSGNGKGQKGQVSNGAALKIGGGETTILHDIKTCYTGDGINNGHNLEYSLKLENENNYQELSAGSYNLTVTYTISE